MRFCLQFCFIKPSHHRIAPVFIINPLQTNLLRSLINLPATAPNVNEAKCIFHSIIWYLVSGMTDVQIYIYWNGINAIQLYYTGIPPTSTQQYKIYKADTSKLVHLSSISALLHRVYASPYIQWTWCNQRWLQERFHLLVRHNPRPSLLIT